MEPEPRSFSMLPTRNKGAYSDTFRSNTIQTNYYRLETPPSISRIYIYRVKFRPEIEADNTKLRLSLLSKSHQEINTHIPNAVFGSSNIFNDRPPNSSDFKITVDSTEIEVKKVKEYNVG